jgi:hypothetical protein
MTAVTETPERLAPVAVDCTFCLTQFLSRARDRMPVHCPRCGHSVRVKRPGGPTGPETWPQPTAEGDQDDDDGDTYIRDEHGRLVPAEWTADGDLIPATHTRQTPRPAPAAFRSGPANPAGELAARHYRVNPDTAHGGCQIIETMPLGQADALPIQCLSWAEHTFGPARVCAGHHTALTTPRVKR